MLINAVTVVTSRMFYKKCPILCLPSVRLATSPLTKNRLLPPVFNLKATVGMQQTFAMVPRPRQAHHRRVLLTNTEGRRAPFSSYILKVYWSHPRCVPATPAI